MTEKMQIEIAQLLPAVPDARDACLERLGDLLRANDGIDIEAAHVPDANGSGQICIHDDPDRLSIGEVRDLHPCDSQPGEWYCIPGSARYNPWHHVT